LRTQGGQDGRRNCPGVPVDNTDVCLPALIAGWGVADAQEAWLMRLWDWIVDAIIGRGTNTSSGPSQPAHASPDGAETTAVATLEPPEATDETQETVDAEPWWEGGNGSHAGPLTVERPELPPEALPLQNVLALHLDGHDLRLPPLPHVPNLVLGHLRKSDWNAAELAEIISQDQVIAASVIRTCNSPIYCALHRITSLRAAVTRLGAVVMRTLMMHQSLHGAVFHSSGRGAEWADVVWRRSLASAAIMRLLSEFTGTDEEDAFLIGLLHDIGDVIVLRQVHGQAKLTGYTPDLPTFDHLCHECHQQFGELIAGEWKLPDELTSLIADHHRHPTTGGPLQVKRLQLQLADVIAALLGYRAAAPFNLLDTDAARALGLSERSDFVDALPGFPARVDELVGCFLGGEAAR
jgi:HD-like signal output (HDOD) protein